MMTRRRFLQLLAGWGAPWTIPWEIGASPKARCWRWFFPVVFSIDNDG